MYSERPRLVTPAKKLRVLHLGSCPATNRGARANLLTIHERLLARGHESSVIDLTPYHHVKQRGVYYPRSTFHLARFLLDVPADVVHLHIGSELNIAKLALAAMVNRLPEARKACTLHLGGHFYPNRRLGGSRWGATGRVLRNFDMLIVVNPEIASFVERVGVRPERVHLITPFPRLRVSEGVTLPDEMESFCRRHTPLMVSVGEFEPESNLPAHFDILSKVRERYPSAGLIVAGEGGLHFNHAYARALHQDSNHIELAGALSRAAVSELIQRANVLLATSHFDSDSFPIHEARKANTQVVATYLPTQENVEIAALKVLRSLQIPRPQYEDAPAALTDGVDDVIRLYKQMAAKRDELTVPMQTGYEWPSIGWGL
jgi:glycosyltransferase involved in cell wall biosynthesis